jgi:hypothetical protein
MAKQESAAERARRRAKTKGKKNRLKLHEGENILRILPTPEGESTPELFMEYQIHYEVGKDKRSVRCGKDPESGKGKCWLCDVQVPKLRKTKKTQRAEALTAKVVTVVQVATIEDDKFTGPFLFEPSSRIAGKILNNIIGSRKRSYTDLKKGYNFTIERTGTGKETRYGDPFPDDEPSKVPTSVSEKMKPFDEWDELAPYSEKKAKAAYFGEDVEEDEEDEEDTEGIEEDEEDEKPKKKKKKPSKKEDEDEDEDESDEDEDADEDEDEDEEKPKKKKKPAKKKAVEEDEDEDEDESEDEEDEEDSDDEDEDEEDEDEKPKKKSKSTKKPVKKKKKVVEEDEDEEDEDEEDE